MPTTQASQIIRQQLGYANAYLILSERQAILVDAGLPRREHIVLATLRDQQLPPEALRLIVVTHTHYDHCGSLSALKDLTGAPVLVHEAEADCLRQGFRALPNGTRWFSKMLVACGRRLNAARFSYPPATPDITIGDRFDLQDFGIDGYVLPTPGHTAGSLSVIMQNKHALAGDAIFHVFPNSAFPPFADDQLELLRSWKKLLDSGCEFFYPGHGTLVDKSLLRKSYEAQKRRLAQQGQFQYE